MFARTAIFVALTATTLSFIGVLVASLLRQKLFAPSLLQLATGFITNFFDTLGIGSFATTTAIFKLKKMVSDELFPGTLNVGHTLPTIFQAFIYIAVIEVDPTTLVSLISSAVVGAWFGAGIVSKLSRRAVQRAMGLALLTAATAMLAKQLNFFPAGGNALELAGWRLVIGIVMNFLFGAVSTVGIGFYAPCMTLVSLLGMNPAASFPIMMGSSAFLMPVASSRFVLGHVYCVPAAIGLTIGGILGVPLAAFVVKSLPLEVMRWMVIVVVVYTAVLMLRSALYERLPNFR